LCGAIAPPMTPSRSGDHAGHYRLQNVAHVGWFEPHLQATLTAIDIDLLPPRRALLDHGAHESSLSERDDRADLEAGNAFRLSSFIICADLPPPAAASFFIENSWSDGTMTPTGFPSTTVFSVFNTRRILAKCLQPDALGVGFVVVGVNGEGNAGDRERARCGGGFGHARCLAPLLRGASEDDADAAANKVRVMSRDGPGGALASRTKCRSMLRSVVSLAIGWVGQAAPQPAKA